MHAQTHTAKKIGKEDMMVVTDNSLQLKQYGNMPGAPVTEKYHLLYASADL